MFDDLPAEVVVYEVGPRDGLQNEKAFIPSEDKVRLIEALATVVLKQRNYQFRTSALDSCLGRRR